MKTAFYTSVGIAVGARDYTYIGTETYRTTENEDILQRADPFIIVHSKDFETGVTKASVYVIASSFDSDHNTRYWMAKYKAQAAKKRFSNWIADCETVPQIEELERISNIIDEIVGGKQ